MAERFEMQIQTLPTTLPDIRLVFVSVPMGLAVFLAEGAREDSSRLIKVPFVESGDHQADGDGPVSLPLPTATPLGLGPGQTTFHQLHSTLYIITQQTYKIFLYPNLANIKGRMIKVLH